MSRRHLHVKKRSVKAGLPPGTLVHIGDKPSQAQTISIMTYGPDALREYSAHQAAEAITAMHDVHHVTWVDVDGVHDVEMIRELGTALSLHPLVLEDIVNTAQRPKIEDYGTYLFVVVRMTRSLPTGGIQSEQVSIILGEQFLLSFQEGINGDLFDPVRDRIRSAKGKIRTMGPDYLAYALIDAIVDGYFAVLEELGERILTIEEELALSPSRETLFLINELKKDILFLRKSVWPLREAVSFLERGDSAILNGNTRLYFRDVYDHTIQVIDSAETYRDLLAGMLDLYLSSISNKTNEIMKFLTIIGTIFIPLTFIVGVYGMNFKYMPELEWHYAYGGLWGIMVLIGLSLTYYFKRKGWI